MQGLSTLDPPAPTIAPESYAFISCEHRPDAQDTKTAEQPESMFACDLTSTERQVLRALEGKTPVILGGICKPYTTAALIRDLHLRDLDWIESTEYDHGQQAVSRLRDPNIGVVVFALRWAAHAHGSIHDAASSLGILAVSLPGGYSPRQVLHQLCAQVSGSLVA